MRRITSVSPRPARTSAPAERGESGATIIEFALVMPVLLLLLCGIVVYGLYLGAGLAVSYAASEAARASEAGLSDSERETLADQSAATVMQSYAPLLSANATTIISGPVAGNDALFSVSVTYSFKSFGIGQLGAIVPLPLTDPAATVVVSHGGY